MEKMTTTEDGFKIAEKDLELRGSGEFFGTKQHGLPEFRIANIFEDVKILKLVQELALKIEMNDPKLEKEENKKLNGAIQTYDILLKSNVEENKQLKDNWNKLKEYIKETKLKEFEKSYGKRFGKTFIQAEIIVCNMILDKMKELEQGSDINE